MFTWSNRTPYLERAELSTLVTLAKIILDDEDDPQTAQFVLNVGQVRPPYFHHLRYYLETVTDHVDIERRERGRVGPICLYATHLRVELGVGGPVQLGCHIQAIKFDRYKHTRLHSYNWLVVNTLLSQLRSLNSVVFNCGIARPSTRWFESMHPNLVRKLPSVPSVELQFHKIDVYRDTHAIPKHDKTAMTKKALGWYPCVFVLAHSIVFPLLTRRHLADM